MILGGSNLAYYLSKSLAKSKISVRLIEMDRNRAIELSNILDDVLVIHGDGTVTTYWRKRCWQYGCLHWSHRI